MVLRLEGVRRPGGGRAGLSRVTEAEAVVVGEGEGLLPWDVLIMA